jgi:hypothetical protein
LGAEGGALPNGRDPPRDTRRMVADVFQVLGEPHRGDDEARTLGNRLAPGEGREAERLDVAFRLVEGRVGRAGTQRADAGSFRVSAATPATNCARTPATTAMA